MTGKLSDQLSPRPLLTGIERESVRANVHARTQKNHVQHSKKNSL